jgi:photosystem II stability/assembly factor-like uncharacterized protein
VDVSPTELPFVPFGSFFLDAQAAWLQTLDPYAGTNGLIRTTDGGKTWMTVSGFAILHASYTFDDLDHGRAATVDVGAGNAYYTLYQTSDGGANWSLYVITPPSPEEGLPSGTIHLCNICGDALYFDPSRVVITHGDLASDPVGSVRFSISTDLGQTWQDQALPLPSDRYKDGLVAPHSPQFFGSSDGVLPVSISKFNTDGSSAYDVLVLYITHDGGQTWSASPALAENVSAFSEVQGLTLQDVFVSCSSKLCATHDGAQTWQSLNVPAPADSGAQFDFVSPTVGWVVIPGENYSSSLFQTTDGGVTWLKLSPLLLP